MNELVALENDKVNVLARFVPYMLCPSFKSLMREKTCLISAEGADFYSKKEEVVRRPRGLCKSAGLHAKDVEKGMLHGKCLKLLQTRLLSFTSYHFRISPNTFHMSASLKPYPPETKTEEIDLAHLYELWSKCVFECFWCYALRSLERAFLPEMRHARLPLDTTHVDIWAKQTAFIIYLQNYRSSEVTPCTKANTFTTYGKHFPLYTGTFSAFDCYVILVADFKIEIVAFGNRATETNVKRLRNERWLKSLLLLRQHRLEEKVKACQGRDPTVNVG